MAERIDLTVPDQVKPGTPSYTLAAIVKNFELGTLQVHLRGANGELKIITKEGVGPQLRALNKANLTIKSEIRRIYEQLQAAGDLPGAIVGVPD